MMSKGLGFVYDVMFGFSLVFRVIIGVAVLSYVASVSTFSWPAGIFLSVSGICYMLYPMLRSFKEAMSG